MERCRRARELQAGVLTGTPSANDGRAVLVEPREPGCHAEAIGSKAYVWADDLGKSPKIDYVAKPCAVRKKIPDKVIVLLFGQNTANTFVVPWVEDTCCGVYAAFYEYVH